MVAFYGNWRNMAQVTLTMGGLRLSSLVDQSLA